MNEKKQCCYEYFRLFKPKQCNHLKGIEKIKKDGEYYCYFHAPDKNEDEIKKFWKFLFYYLKEQYENEYIENIDLEGFVFPEFTIHTFEEIEGRLKERNYIGLLPKEIFEKRINLRDAEFLENVNFSNIAFDNGANFKFAIFNKFTKFNNSIFNDGNNSYQVIFTNSKFKQEVEFRNCIFNSNVIFDNARFFNKTDFTKSTFNKTILFRDVIFKSIVIFYKTEINNTVSFINIYFIFENRPRSYPRYVYYEYEEMTKKFYEVINENKTSVIFNEAIFNNKVLFNKIFISDIAEFVETEFNNKVKFNKIYYAKGYKGYEGHREPTSYSRSAKVLFTSANFKFQDNISFINSDLGQWSFSYTPISDVKFLNITWKGDGKPKRNHTFDEFIVTSNPDIESGISYDIVREVYRQLRLNYEKRLDYSTASDFHIGQMEMRLKDPDEKWYNKIVLRVYKLISNYGESWVRPLIGLSLTYLSGFYYIFYNYKFRELLNEFTYEFDDLSLSPFNSIISFILNIVDKFSGLNSFMYKLKNVLLDTMSLTFQIMSIFPTKKVKDFDDGFIVILLRLLTILFGTLFVLTLRRRFKR